MNFSHGALRRSWLIIAVPLLTALAMARPLTLRGFLLNVPTLVSVGIVAGVLVAIMLPLLAGKSRAILDHLSATRVVTAPTWRPANIQLLSERGVDPILRRQVLVVLSLMALWCVVYWLVTTNPVVSADRGEFDTSRQCSYIRAESGVIRAADVTTQWRASWATMTRTARRRRRPSILRTAT
jgi:hypothetical protein